MVKYLEKILLYLAMLLLGTLLSLVFLQVVLRNVFHYSLVFIEELSIILLAWCAFFSAAYALRKKAHVAVDYFFLKFGKGAQRAIYFATMFVIFLFILYIAWYGWRLADRQMIVPLPVTGFPRGYIYLALPVSCVFMIVFLIDELIRTVRNSSSEGEEQ